MGWISPTSHNDPDSSWTNEPNAYDGDTGTLASCSTAARYLELILGSAINCDKVRVYASAVIGDCNIAIDVYYSAAWHNIFSGLHTKNVWVEHAIGATESVDKMRVKTNNSNIHQLKECEFNDTGGAPPSFTPRNIGII